jgi:aromatic ring-opening dioxygenase catalytic subunit (LigB family)
MASLVGAFAASHGPLIIREWERVPAAQKSRMAAAYRDLGRRLGAAKPDVLIVVSPDHWSNFFLDNYPAVCIGVGETNDGPPEPWMKDFPHRTLAGHPQLAMHIANTALAEGYEPAVSHRLKLDHGSCIPLWRMELERLPKIVPLLVNSIEPPMPSLGRCYRWGELLRQAIESYAEPLRVAILGTGGLSHSIGEPTMGAIYEEFDRETIGRFSRPADELIGYLDAQLPTSGNGSEEIRNWLVVGAMATDLDLEWIEYVPGYRSPALTGTGLAFAAWTTLG